MNHDIPVPDILDLKNNTEKEKKKKYWKTVEIPLY